MRRLGSQLAGLALCPLLLVFWGCSGDGSAPAPQDDPGTDSVDQAGDPGSMDLEPEGDFDSDPPLVEDGRDSETSWEELVFPDDFLFGTAISGFQADMGCPTLSAGECEDPNSDWYVFVTSPDLVEDPQTFLQGDLPSAGPGHWELYPTDFDLAVESLHTNAFRTSLEWSRIFPSATDGIEGYEALRAAADPGALAHYRAMFEAMRQRGLTPLVTINHYTLPTWIHDAEGCHRDLSSCSPRGWVDGRRTVTEIAKYAGFVAAEFGDQVDLWATLNEPFAIVLPGYVYPSADRSNPPAVAMAFEEAKTVLAALVEAHARMYDAVKANDTVDADTDGQVSRVGLVYAMAPARPSDASESLDVQAAENVFYLWNLVYLNAVIRGDLDGDLDGSAEHREDLAGRMDYLGINYYTGITVEGFSIPIFPDLSPLATFNPFTLSVWEDYPRGIYEMVRYVQENYGLPIIITENGVSDPRDDGTGPRYLVQHLTWLARAIRDGARVEGYFVWSLIDNYEWNHGMTMPFGLYAVDPEDPGKTRTARQAARVYARVTRLGQIPIELQQRYPAPE